MTLACVNQWLKRTAKKPPRNHQTVTSMLALNNCVGTYRNNILIIVMCRTYKLITFFKLVENKPLNQIKQRSPSGDFPRLSSSLWAWSQYFCTLYAWNPVILCLESSQRLPQSKHLSGGTESKFSSWRAQLRPLEAGLHESAWVGLGKGH